MHPSSLSWIHFLTYKHAVIAPILKQNRINSFLTLHPPAILILCSLSLKTFWRVVFALCCHLVTLHLLLSLFLCGFCLYCCTEVALPRSLVTSMLPMQWPLPCPSLTGLLISIQQVYSPYSCYKQSPLLASSDLPSSGLLSAFLATPSQTPRSHPHIYPVSPIGWWLPNLYLQLWPHHWTPDSNIQTHTRCLHQHTYKPLQTLTFPDGTKDFSPNWFFCSVSYFGK